MPKLIGEVVAVEWDDNDEPTEICLETDTERFFIEKDDVYRELLKCVGCEVEVTADVEEDAQGDSVITVKDYDILEDGVPVDAGADDDDAEFSDDVGLDDEEDVAEEEDW